MRLSRVLIFLMLIFGGLSSFLSAGDNVKKYTVVDVMSQDYEIKECVNVRNEFCDVVKAMRDSQKFDFNFKTAVQTDSGLHDTLSDAVNSALQKCYTAEGFCWSQIENLSPLRNLRFNLLFEKPK